MDRHKSVTQNAESLALTEQWDNYGDSGWHLSMYFKVTPGVGVHAFNPLQKQRPVDLHETGQPGLHSEVLASQSYMKRCCLKIKYF